MQQWWPVLKLHFHTTYKENRESVLTAVKTGYLLVTSRYSIFRALCSSIVSEIPYDFINYRKQIVTHDTCL